MWQSPSRSPVKGVKGKHMFRYAQTLRLLTHAKTVSNVVLLPCRTILIELSGLCHAFFSDFVAHKRVLK